ncbi:MAG: hypothetical protein EP318_18665 [Rhodobacteraceae bacterium]|nr:MAG: hypothetical protein EP318_18665 [Paracoccaceae bacterium]
MLQNEDRSPGMEKFVTLIRTGLETTVLTAHSAAMDGHRRDLERMALMVGDRSELLSEIRYAYLTRHKVTDTAERMELVRLTVLAERMFWALDMLRKTLNAPEDQAVAA